MNESPMSLKWHEGGQIMTELSFWDELTFESLLNTWTNYHCMPIPEQTYTISKHHEDGEVMRFEELCNFAWIKDQVFWKSDHQVSSCFKISLTR